MTMASTAPDGYSKMRAALAKHPFDRKTIIEALVFCIDILTEVTGDDVGAKLIAAMANLTEEFSQKRRATRVVAGELRTQVRD
jgi:hypothetical protein